MRKKARERYGLNPGAGRQTKSGQLGLDFAAADGGLMASSKISLLKGANE
jgi:hypothetical protein